MKHKKDWGPGYRVFLCEGCSNSWKEKCRDCTSQSGSVCPNCFEFTNPSSWEEHYEWQTDGHGNLLDENDK